MSFLCFLLLDFFKLQYQVPLMVLLGGFYWICPLQFFDFLCYYMLVEETVSNGFSIHEKSDSVPP